jgi:hypothetical protein
MRQMFRLILVIGVLFLLTSCGASVISKNTANLQYSANPSSGRTGGDSNLKIYISGIIDERASAGDVCNSYDTDGVIDGKWSSSKDVKLFIEEAIAAELSSDGVQVIGEENRQNYPNVPELKGKVRIFYGWLEDGSNYASKVNVDFYIVNKTYTIFYKSYLGENSTGVCGVSLVQSTRNAMSAAAADIKEMLIKEAAYVK